MEEEPRLYDLIYAIVRQIPPARWHPTAKLQGLPADVQPDGWFALSALAMTRHKDEVEDVPWQRVINSRGQISPHGFGMGGSVQRQILKTKALSLTSKARLTCRVSAGMAP
jgi:methylated-DNA-protein-cysteine methyltransferase-like protein